MMCLKFGKYSHLAFVNGYVVCLYNCITTKIKRLIHIGSEKKFIGDKYFIEFEIMFMECRRRVHPQCKTYYYVLEDNHKWIGVIIPAHVLLQ